MNKTIIIMLCGLFIGSTTFAVETKNTTFSYSKSSVNQLSEQMQQAANSDDQIKALIKVPKVASFDILPITTSNMTSGEVQKQKVNLVNLDKPIFIVGSDAFSVRWLADNAAKLKKINAIGLLVQAENNEDVKRVQQAAQGAIILPMSGNLFGEKLGIHHYPVLITKNLIEQ